jgi:hypothetical protein
MQLQLSEARIGMSRAREGCRHSRGGCVEWMRRPFACGQDVGELSGARLLDVGVYNNKSITIAWDQIVVKHFQDVVVIP